MDEKCFTFHVIPKTSYIAFQKLIKMILSLQWFKILYTCKRNFNSEHTIVIIKHIQQKHINPSILTWVRHGIS